MKTTTTTTPLPPLVGQSIDQSGRAFQGDRFHHLHSRDIEDASLTTISDLINRTTGAADIPLSAFVAAAVEVCGADCSSIGVSEADLSDSYSVAWEVKLKTSKTYACSFLVRWAAVGVRNTSAV